MYECWKKMPEKEDLDEGNAEKVTYISVGTVFAMAGSAALLHL